MREECSGTAEGSFDKVAQKAHALGREVLSVHAADVDSKARFPHEAFDALKQAKLLSAYVPRELGGMGLDVVQIAKICEILGQYCGSSAMIYAMHRFRWPASCIMRQQSAYFRDYLQRTGRENNA